MATEPDRRFGQGLSVAFVAPIVVAVLADVLVDGTIRTLGARSEFLDGLLRINPSTNDGIAFGLLKASGPLPIVLAVVALTLLVAFAVRQRNDPSLQLALGLLVGGAIANLVERFAAGAVLDYVDVGIGDLRWPTFNVGDMTISLALLILIAVSLRTQRSPDPSP